MSKELKKDRLLFEFSRLVNIMEKLRGPEGCPWDKAQTLDSLQKYLIEEAYEVVEAYQKNDMDLLKEELGDVLLQIIFQSQVAKEEGLFKSAEVLRCISEKLIRRDPHVFSDKYAVTPADVSVLWKEVKRKEKRENSETASILDRYSRSQPALRQAAEIQKIASEVGFDWDNTSDVIQKIKEELSELEEAIENGDQEFASSELGDLLFAAVNLSRFISTDPELALLKTNLKFMERFKYIEESVRKDGKNIEDMSLEELDYYWEEAKKKR